MQRPVRRRLGGVDESARSGAPAVPREVMNPRRTSSLLYALFSLGAAPRSARIPSLRALVRPPSSRHVAVGPRSFAAGSVGRRVGPVPPSGRLPESWLKERYGLHDPDRPRKRPSTRPCARIEHRNSVDLSSGPSWRRSRTEAHAFPGDPARAFPLAPFPFARLSLALRHPLCAPSIAMPRHGPRAASLRLLARRRTCSTLRQIT